MAPDAFGSDLSKLAERFAVAFRRHSSEPAQGGNKLPKLSWTATERAHFTQLVSDRKPTSGADWQSIADALGTGRSGEALRSQLHTKRQGATHAAPEQGQAHAPSCLLSIAARSAVAAPQSEASSPAPLCTPLRIPSSAQSDATAFPTPHPAELEVQSATSGDDEDSSECVLMQGCVSHAEDAMAAQDVASPRHVTRSVQTDPDALSELAMESERRMGELLAMRKQYADLAANHAQLMERVSTAGVAGRRARPTFLGDGTKRKRVRIGSEHQALLPTADDDDVVDAACPVPAADLALQAQLTHNAALLTRARAKSRRAWPDCGGLRVDLGSIHATRLYERLHDSTQRDEKGRLVVGGEWDASHKRYVGGRAFPGYSEYRGTHAREQGKAHDREEQQRNTVVFSADDFCFAREHVRTHSSPCMCFPARATDLHTRVNDPCFALPRCADPGAQSARPCGVQQSTLLPRRGRLSHRTFACTRAPARVGLHEVRHAQGAPRVCTFFFCFPSYRVIALSRHVSIAANVNEHSHLAVYFHRTRRRTGESMHARTTCGLSTQWS